MGRILAIDLGERRIGLATSDPTRSVAGSFGMLRRSTAEEEFAALRSTIIEQDVDLIVVGLPIGLQGAGGVQAELTRRWVAAFQKDTDVPVELLDERLTTAQAHHTLDAMGVRRKKHREHVDAVAATLLLQTYLERARGSRGAGEQGSRGELSSG